MPTPSDVVAYIGGIKNARILRLIPCLVTIGRNAYPAARYIERLSVPENSPAWLRGEREYDREMVYCAGFLPSCKLRGNVAFTVKYDDREWYVAGYYGNIVKRKQDAMNPNEFNPFGNSFYLTPWAVPNGGKIDQYARVPYRRVACHLSERFRE